MKRERERASELSCLPVLLSLARSVRLTAAAVRGSLTTSVTSTRLGDLALIGCTPRRRENHTMPHRKMGTHTTSLTRTANSGRERARGGSGARHLRACRRCELARDAADQNTANTLPAGHESLIRACYNAVELVIGVRMRGQHARGCTNAANVRLRSCACQSAAMRDERAGSQSAARGAPSKGE